VVRDGRTACSPKSEGRRRGLQYSVTPTPAPVLSGVAGRAAIGRGVERVAFVAERTLPNPSHLVRWLLAPAFLGVLAALFAAAAARLRHHTRQPTLPRMSDEWLRTHDAEAGHRNEFWRDRW
jgi:hypothetical protein